MLLSGNTIGSGEEGEGAPITPRKEFLRFLNHVVSRNLYKYTKYPREAGAISSTRMMVVFMCVGRSEYLQRELYSEGALDRFPYWTFLLSGNGPTYSFMDPEFKQVDRLGGSATHMEGELRDKLDELKRNH
jgi:hypothetical protein